MHTRLTFHSRQSVEYDYDYVRDCESNGCDSICRCGRYENLRITSASPTVSDIKITKTYKFKSGARRWRDYTPTLIERYCIDRLLRVFKAYDPTLYEAHVSRGYYGEEIDSVSFRNERQFFDAVGVMLGLQSDLDKVLYVISSEYSYLHPLLNKVKNCNVETVELEKLGFNNEYLYRLKKTEDKNYVFEPGVPIGVAFRKANGEINLIDGYHRYCATSSKSAEYIVLS